MEIDTDLNPSVESGSINIFCVCLVLYLKTFTIKHNRNRQNKNMTIFNIICWVDGSMGRWEDRLIDQESVLFFHNFLKNALQKSFQFIFFLFFITLQK